MIDPIHSRSQSAVCHHLKALSVLELLITMSLVGVLLTILLTAIRDAREKVRRVQCQDNLRQFGIALHPDHNAHGKLPAGWSEVTGKVLATSWIPKLLPFLEQSDLGVRMRSDRPEVFSDGMPNRADF
ncbi:MAG: DUF1559 domain-containing protein [Planctomycetaceae bacterium]